MQTSFDDKVKLADFIWSAPTDATLKVDKYVYTKVAGGWEPDGMRRVNSITVADIIKVYGKATLESKFGELEIVVTTPEPPVGSVVKTCNGFFFAHLLSGEWYEASFADASFDWEYVKQFSPLTLMTEGEVIVK